MWGIIEGKRLGVVLFQLGGPDTLDAIEPFLYNLFCDPDIIDFPFARIGRKPLAKLISTTRANKVRHHYEVIGGGSPIRKFTERQACALQRRLRDRGVDAHCFVAMRYWRPFTADAVAQVKRAGCDHLVLLPLYPQYSSTTTGSSLNEWQRLYSPNGARVAVVREFYPNPTYIDALVRQIEATLRMFETPSEVELIFSAHSVPVAVVENGDPYQRQIEETVSLVMEHLAGSVRVRGHRLCYQSKVGASRWLQPTLRSTLKDVAAQGITEVCVVPISFVSDHVETLGEIDHEARAQAASLGIRNFRMMSGLNDSPAFIAALEDVVLRAVNDSLLPRSLDDLVAAD
ncbi:MAG: ferrochelatase [Acidobacteria bacterium]|nr:ferrochelatase [Acidobacteriota bacterium]